MKVLILHLHKQARKQKGDHLFPMQLPNTYTDK